ncbi:MAG: flagellar motor switch protein FliN [Oscillospiraceae bacterium]|jgi:flagellar motor switch protein FliN/FliY|nr:flagellar motor switch protein FliN [Oscillospiraceae bacterium]
MDQLDQNTIDQLLNEDAFRDTENDLTEMEADAIGESFNISMGSAAKALSTMLNMQVLITTPEVAIEDSKDFQYKSMVPAVGVKIDYIEGLAGANFLVVKQHDAKVMVDIMMGNSGENIDDEFTELHVSAVSEIMNQMMGASSTSLATFFNRKINISTPSCTLLEEYEDSTHVFDIADRIVVVKLRLMIGEIIDSEIINVMPMGFAKDLAKNLIDTQLSSAAKVLEKTPPQPKEQPVKSVPRAAQTRPQAIPQKEQKQQYNDVNVTKANFVSFDSNHNNTGPTVSNLNIIMDVPLEITVEIGKTSRQVKEIMEFTQGSIIELDKQAGDPVDIIVNGELIAKGDVVVIDDYFGVRITEIIEKNN